MADESVQRNGAKWLLAVLLVSAVFGVLFVVGYFTNIYKRGAHEGQHPSTAINSKQ